MAQIMITQFNLGIGIKNTFINPDKTPKNIYAHTCSVDIVYPDLTKENVPVDNYDASNGIVLFMLGVNQTEQTGLHKLYFNIIDSSSLITAQDMVTYYVLAKTGGV